MSELIQHLRQHLPDHQIIIDDLRRLAYGTDASFYRLTPKVITIVESENDLKTVLSAAKQHKTPVTFRAAGTSLSGQAITDGILALIGEGFATYEQNTDASKVKLGPGIIGGEVNRRLAPHGKKIGPDPASKITTSNRAPPSNAPNASRPLATAVTTNPQCSKRCRKILALLEPSTNNNTRLPDNCS